MSRICKSCSIPERAELDEVLRSYLDQAGGVVSRIPYSAIKQTAERFELLPIGLKRHFENHVAAGRLNQRDQLAQDRQLHALAVVASREARQAEVGAALVADPDAAGPVLVEELTGLAKALEDSLARCEVGGDERGVRDTGTALRGVVMARARLLGLLEKRREPCPDPPPVCESPEFATVLATILAPLARYPDARRDVLAALETVRGAGVAGAA